MTFFEQKCPGTGRQGETNIKTVSVVLIHQGYQVAPPEERESGTSAMKEDQTDFIILAKGVIFLAWFHIFRTS